jgi:hypothetical protein
VPYVNLVMSHVIYVLVVKSPLDVKMTVMVSTLDQARSEEPRRPYGKMGFEGQEMENGCTIPAYDEQYSL